MSDNRLDWFRCHQSKLLGALAAMPPDEQLIYVTVLLRIYEVNGPCPDDARALSLRTHLPVRRAVVAIDGLLAGAKPKLVRVDGGMMNGFAETELDERISFLKNQKAAGKKGASRRWEKTKENQSNGHGDPIATPMGSDAHLHLQRQKQSKRDSAYAESPRAPAALSLFGSSDIGTQPDLLPPVKDDWPSNAEALERFWNAYPPQRRTEKAKVAEKLVALHRSKRVTWAALMAGVGRYSRSSDVARGFAKGPMPWLNGGCWDDEIQTGGRNGNGAYEIATNAGGRSSAPHEDAIVAGMGRVAARRHAERADARRRDGAVEGSSDDCTGSNLESARAPHR